MIKKNFHTTKCFCPILNYILMITLYLIAISYVHLFTFIFHQKISARIHHRFHFESLNSFSIYIQHDFVFLSIHLLYVCFKKKYPFVLDIWTIYGRWEHKKRTIVELFIENIKKSNSEKAKTRWNFFLLSFLYVVCESM